MNFPGVLGSTERKEKCITVYNFLFYFQATD